MSSNVIIETDYETITVTATRVTISDGVITIKTPEGNELLAGRWGIDDTGPLSEDDHRPRLAVRPGGEARVMLYHWGRHRWITSKPEPGCEADQDENYALSLRAWADSGWEISFASEDDE